MYKKQENWHKFYVFVTILQRFSSLTSLMSFIMDVSAQNYQSEHFDCAKEFSFRKSDLSPRGEIQRVRRKIFFQFLENP